MRRWNSVSTLLAAFALTWAASQSHAQTFNTLFSFNGTNGDVPDGNLIVSGSTLYGMAAGGGANGDGTVFSIPVTGGSPLFSPRSTGPTANFRLAV